MITIDKGIAVMRVTPEFLPFRKMASVLAVSLVLGACSSEDATVVSKSTPAPDTVVKPPVSEPDPSEKTPEKVEKKPEPQPEVVERKTPALDKKLRQLIDDDDLDVGGWEKRDLPSIDSPLAQLGKQLYFSKSLGGAFDSACVTCHHPMLGGGDNLSLPIGVDAIKPDLLGIGRVHESGLPLVPRNAPTIFNIALWDSSMFWDSRVESLGKEPFANGTNSGIRSPEVAMGESDPQAGENLVSTQARFPITSVEEMKTEAFEEEGTLQEIRDHLAARLGNYGEGKNELEKNRWLEAFQTAYGSSEGPKQLVTYDNIAHAIGEYQRSMVFVESPWKKFLDGKDGAMSESQKKGALLFFKSPEAGGAGCATCHSGVLFSDEKHHNVAFPQIGPGKEETGGGDHGRERETGQGIDKFRFRTPTLLNIEVTGPYGHVGSLASLKDVVKHHLDPKASIERYFDKKAWCDLPQFSSVKNCETLYPYAEDNTKTVLKKLEKEWQKGDAKLPKSVNLEDSQVDDLVAFLTALTDPCVKDRKCMSDWIADPKTDKMDDHLLIAVDREGKKL